jgi:hypothetical protein
MTKILTFASGLAIALVLVAGAAANTTTKPAPKTHAPKTRACNHPVKRGGRCAPTAKPAPNKPAPKTQTFDKRFDCGAALPLSYLDSVYASNGWSDGVTLKGAASNSTYRQDGFRGVSICTYQHNGNGYGGSLAIVYGTGAASFYKQDHAAAESSGAKSCQSLVAAGKQPTDPRQCGPVPVRSFGAQAYESGAYIAVLKGDAFVSFESGQQLVGGGVHMSGGSPIPPSMIETVERYVFAHVPRHG